ncbi:unnamed protein product [Triticum turgidum subsp. durum]|uniref:Uncharacterized protein n=1 Tax=Triticum turgidum subsp. durum TaxID=4567 RepID=A0A9R0R8F6_TRITD|nr:unnamed protein product [Triticum turgidum subsp. durum]
MYRHFTMRMNLSLIILKNLQQGRTRPRRRRAREASRGHRCQLQACLAPRSWPAGRLASSGCTTAQRCTASSPPDGYQQPPRSHPPLAETADCTPMTGSTSGFLTLVDPRSSAPRPSPATTSQSYRRQTWTIWHQSYGTPSRELCSQLSPVQRSPAKSCYPWGTVSPAQSQRFSG